MAPLIDTASACPGGCHEWMAVHVSAHLWAHESVKQQPNPEVWVWLPSGLVQETWKRYSQPQA